MKRAMEGKTPSAKYDGFTSCPIVLGYDQVVEWSGVDWILLALAVSDPGSPCCDGGC